MLIRGKICLLGEGAVGKTSLKDRYFGKGFKVNYLPTLGADISVKDIKSFNTRLGPMDFKLQIWDLAGQPLYTKVRPDYYQGTLAAFLVFDVTRPETLSNIENWIYELVRYANRPEISLIVIGNKIDLRDENKDHVTRKKVLPIIREYKRDFSVIRKEIPYYETSAKTGEKVEDAFKELCNMIFETYADQIE